MNQDQVRKIKTAFARCGTDESFKKAMLQDGTATLRAEGIEMPAGFNIKVVENTPTVLNVILPNQVKANGELSDQQLEAVAGGDFMSFMTTVSVGLGEYVAAPMAGFIKDTGIEGVLLKTGAELQKYDPR